MKKATKWGASEYLATEEDMAAYLNATLEDGNTSVIAAALGDIARAKGLTQLAKETGITRDGLYKALSPTERYRAESHKGIRLEARCGH